MIGKKTMRDEVKRNKAKRKVAMRILDGPQRDRLVTTLAERGETDLADVEPAVRRIV